MNTLTRRLLPTFDILFPRSLASRTCPLATPLLRCRQGPRSPAAIASGRRTYALHGRPYIPSYARPSPPGQQQQPEQQQAASRSDPDAPPMDEDIPSDWVQIVNAERKLDPPLRLFLALRTFDRSNNALVQMAPKTADRPAVCKVMTLEEVEERRKERERAHAKPVKEPSKQLEFNWGIEDHDLEYRLKKLQQFLDKGKQVEILLLPKRKKKLATKEQAIHVLRRVKAAIIQSGGMEWKNMSGSLLGVLTLFVRKDTKKLKNMSQQTGSGEEQSTTADSEGEKEKENEEEKEPGNEENNERETNAA